MSIADTGRQAFRRDSRNAFQELLDALEEITPTQKYRRSDRVSGIVRVVPRDPRGTLPAYRPVANSGSHPARSVLIDERGRELRRVVRRKSVLSLAPAPGPGGRGPSLLDNPFLEPPRHSDPPPLWVLWARTRRTARTQKTRRPRPRQSLWLFLLTLATIVAVEGMMWRDTHPVLAAKLVADLTRAASRVGSFVLELGIR